jgi:ubiquinone/menaquinone biosynthesis C-methylase UbiE
MLEAARRRAERAGLGNIKYHRCTPDSLGLTEQADFALTFWMVHEVPDKQRLLAEIKSALKPGGKLLLVEPKLHVTGNDFNATVSTALSTGFQIVKRPYVPISMAVLLINPAG